MIINAAKYSCAAGHGINEDSCLCSAEKGIFIVADGLGGHSSGEKASLAAVDYFERNCNGGYTEKRITELMEGANTEVIEKGDGGKTTVAVAFTENGNFIYANAGDSRVYYFRDGKIIAQTKDHSVCQASADMGMIRQEDIRGSEDRSRLLKVLGGDEKLNLKKHYAPIKIQNGDAFLLCSDGFWEYVYETEMEADLLKSNSSEVWLKHMLKRHILRAENKGDNYTAICGMIHFDGSETYVPPASALPASEVKTSEVSNSNKKNKTLIAIAAAGVLLIAAIIALAAFMKGNGGGDVITDTTETTPVSETTSAISEPGTEENGIETSSEAVSDTDISETGNETIFETSAEGTETSSESVSDTDTSKPETESETISENTDTISETTAEEAETDSEAVSDTDISEPETENETISENTDINSETAAEETEAVFNTDISKPEAENNTISETNKDESENITEEKTPDGIENDLP